MFALGIMPYISASIFQQIAQAVVPQIDKMSKDEEGRKRLNQWSRYATVALAAVQAWGFSIFAEGIQGAVVNPGFKFRVLMTFFLTVGAIFVMWLGEQITERGIGNGASLMIFFSIVERIWPSIFSAFGYVSTGVIGAFSLVVLIIIMAGGRGGGRRGDDGGAQGADPDTAAHDGAGAGCARRRAASSRCASTRRASCRSCSRSR